MDEERSFWGACGRCARAARALAGQRYRPIWAVCAAAMLTFATFRAGLLIACREQLTSVAAGEIARCFLIGMRYDAVAIACAIVAFALVLALAPNLAFGRRWFRRAVTVYASAVLTLALTVEVVGAYFFLHFGERLNWMVFEYWGHFEEVAATIWQQYPVWILPVAAIGSFAAGYVLFGWLLWRGARPTGPIWPRPIVAAILMALCFLGARGSVGHHRLRFGPAYFSSNNTICQLALNNFFTLGEGGKSYLSDKLGLAGGADWPSTATAWRVARRMVGQSADTFTAREDNPLWRRTVTSRPRRDYNVVIVIMEGMAGRPVGALGNRPSHTPCLDALAEKGLFFERMYGVGSRTCRGLIGILCGHPDLAGKSIMKRSRALGRFLSLPDILARRGYRTVFIFGGNPDFDNMKGFFRAAGVERFVDEKEMHPEDPVGIWGTHDEGIFRKAHEVFVNCGEEKFFAVVKTLSNHEPFDVPSGRTSFLPANSPENTRINAYRYADWAIGEFFRLASGAPYLRRTIFVLVPDQERTVDRRQILDVEGYHLPCIIYAPGIVQAGRIRAVASQTDISPTVLALLGGAYEHCFLGRNMLSVEENDGFALLRHHSRIGFVWSDRVLVMPPGRPPLLFRTDGPRLEPIPADRIVPEVVKDARLRMLSYYLAAQQLYLDSAFDFPDR